MSRSHSLKLIPILVIFKIGLSSPEFTHKEKPTVDDRSEMNLKRSVSMSCEKKVFQ